MRNYNVNMWWSEFVDDDTEQEALATAKCYVTDGDIPLDEWEFDAEYWDSGLWRVTVSSSQTVMADSEQDALDKAQELVSGCGMKPRDWVIETAN